MQRIPQVSMFTLYIRRDDGHEVEFKAGSKKEHDLVAAVTEKLKNAGVGIFRTENKVLQAVTEAFRDVLYEAKSEILP